MGLPQWVFVVEYVVLFVLRAHFARGYRAREISARFTSATDRALTISTFAGFMILPFVYFVTPWLDFADYEPPAWLPWTGVPIAVVTVWLFWRSHADLGENWSPSVEIRKGHALVSGGVYSLMRHPMYAAIWLWAASQALLLPNWIGGLSALASFAPLYFIRVPREERMMRETFGQSYAEYAARTGRIVPKWSARESSRS